MMFLTQQSSPPTFISLQYECLLNTMMNRDSSNRLFRPLTILITAVAGSLGFASNFIASDLITLGFLITSALLWLILGSLILLKTFNQYYDITVSTINSIYSLNFKEENNEFHNKEHLDLLGDLLIEYIRETQNEDEYAAILEHSIKEEEIMIEVLEEVLEEKEVEVDDLSNRLNDDNGDPDGGEG